MDIHAAKKLMNDNINNVKKTIFIDVRNPFEFKQEHIEATNISNSNISNIEVISLPLNNFNDLNNVSNKNLIAETLQKYSEHLIIFYCQTGKRSQEAYHIFKEYLQNSGNQNINNLENLENLEGGINAWKQANYPTKRQAGKFFPLMQQVQMLMAVMLLVVHALGFMHSPTWFYVSALMAVGLFLAGYTGICGMAKLLAKMPWNQSNNIK